MSFCPIKTCCAFRFNIATLLIQIGLHLKSLLMHNGSESDDVIVASFKSQTLKKDRLTRLWTWKHVLSFKTAALFLVMRSSGYHKFPSLSACEASWPLCVYFLICHFTPMSFKCHTVASTSPLMDKWPPVKAIRSSEIPLWLAIILISLHMNLNLSLLVSLMSQTLCCFKASWRKEDNGVNWFVLRVTCVASAEQLCF